MPPEVEEEKKKSCRLEPGCGLFSFEELYLLSLMPPKKRHAIRVEREQKVEWEIHNAFQYIVTKAQSMRKRGEPDWQEVERDAKEEFGKKLLGEYEL